MKTLRNMLKTGYFWAFTVSLVLASGCDDEVVEIFWDDSSDDGLAGAIVAITDGVLGIIEYFD